MAGRIPLAEARAQLADIVGNAQFGGKVTIITRHGKDAAAIVPVTFVQADIAETKKPSGITDTSSKKSKTTA
jgi:prevent-host-death family protein